ncbi:hypothetical protein Salat_1187000 [Sesamum alatum]|uniref:Retrotransposon Copia-like N-terminal domain-containing protein n=1 Tax=Sesamum alatum TaxID=300844 RepID=A0AAE2CNP5_9LAMI|nr:hypothetical protein Salat_1187000 [Sesamum alatum]
MVLMEEKTTSSSGKKTLEISSLYFLHPLDSPGAIITTCMLNGHNYDMWEKAMMNALRAKNKLRFIDEKKSIQPSIAYEETAKAIWDDLRECFSIGNAPQIHELKGQITSTRQQGMAVIAYYTKLKELWDELASYSKVANCTCGATHDFIREREEEKLH